ncbi:MAG TPA: Rid family hydrolase [Steroidobacteraceae bacterium]|nr:Rid family hydrolase [Steroidobacteraceae bacterium]
MNRILVVSTLAFAQLASAAEEKYPIKLPTPGGEVVLPDAGAKEAHDEWRFAAARRVGDMVYVSGVIVNRRSGEGKDVAAFKLQTRRALERLRAILEAAGSDFQHVAMINSFHVWQGPNFTGSRDEQFQAFEEVIDDFMKPPYPAWTAVGTTGLLSDGGIVEVQLIAKVR